MGPRNGKDSAVSRQAMKSAEVLAAGRKIVERLKGLQTPTNLKPGRAFPTQGPKAEVTEFLRIQAGSNSHFQREAVAVQASSARELEQLISIMESFLYFVEQGLHAALPPERKGQLDVVNDVLERAQCSLDQDPHPGLAAVMIGAALEQFLRSWVEAEELEPRGRPGIEAYAAALKANDKLDKQDGKNITAWAGLRNHAAHGEWERVSNPEEIRLMLAGVNLLMQRHSPG